MSQRRSLAETIVDVGEGALALARVPGIRPLRIDLRLPVEIRFAAGGGFHADLPQFVTRTVFDRPPAHLALAFELVAPLFPETEEPAP